MESREEIADTDYRGNEVVRSCAIAQKISRFESPSARYFALAPLSCILELRETS